MKDTMDDSYSIGEVVMSRYRRSFFIIKDIFKNGDGEDVVRLKKLEKTYFDQVKLSAMSIKYHKLSLLLLDGSLTPEIKRNYKRFKKHAGELFRAVDFIEDELMASGDLPQDYEELDKIKEQGL